MAQDIEPYSIYADKRPQKVAFFVNPDVEIEQINKIIEYNKGKWGGRFNTIILTDGKSLDKKQWDFLVGYDPDVIKLLVPIETGLLKEIEIFTSPYSVEETRGGKQEDDKVLGVGLTEEGFSILPTKDNVMQASRSFGSSPELVLFELDKITDEKIRQFIRNNFGVYEHVMDIDEALATTPKKIFTPQNNEELSKMLEELGSFKPYVYPIQICSLPNKMHDFEPESEAFTIVIGDSVEDITHYWNHIFSIPSWRRTYVNQVWLPVDIAKNEELLNGLKAWLKRLADPGGQTNKTVRFVSTSLDKKQLEDIAKALTQGNWFMWRAEVLDNHNLPAARTGRGNLQIKSDMDLFRLNGIEEAINLSEPKVVEGVMGGEHWMADVHIQHQSEIYKNIINKDYWLKLPKRNLLAHNIFHQPSRVTNEGICSLLMKRAENTIKLKLPDDVSVIGCLLCVPNTPYFTADPRKDIVEAPYYRVARSDKGRYLTGYLDVFSGLWNASHTLEENYWRKMFDVLSAQDPKKDAERLKEISNKISKTKKDFLSTDEGKKWLSEYVLDLSKQQASNGKEVPYKHFLDEAGKEFSKYNEGKPDGQKHKLDEDELRNSISDLLQLGVLFMGLRPRCFSCGAAEWVNVDEVEHEIVCRGCGSSYSINAEPTWYYKLNSLIRDGCSKHGLVPVVLTLGHLFNYITYSSFMMRSSLDLFEKGKEDSIGDLDIVCIRDGEFIIGEVKRSRGLFKAEDFDKMCEIAKRIRPNRVIFSSLDKTPSKITTDGITKIKADLEKLGVEVQWLPLPDHIFEPSPFI